MKAPLGQLVLFMDGKDVVAAVELINAPAYPDPVQVDQYRAWYNGLIDQAAKVVAEQWSIENAERVARGEDDPQTYTADSAVGGLRAEITGVYKAVHPPTVEGLAACYDCGSTIPKHHTPHCDLAEHDAIRDLLAIPGTQWWAASAKPIGERPTTIENAKDRGYTI